MGCSSSCAIVEAFSTALEWLEMIRLGASGVLHILDNFLFIADSHDKCHTNLTNFLSMCEYIGVPTAQDKTVGQLELYSLQGSHFTQCCKKPGCQSISFRNVVCCFIPFINGVKLLLGNYSL